MGPVAHNPLECYSAVNKLLLLTHQQSPRRLARCYCTVASLILDYSVVLETLANEEIFDWKILVETVPMLLMIGKVGILGVDISFGS